METWRHWRLMKLQTWVQFSRQNIESRKETLDISLENVWIFVVVQLLSHVRLIAAPRTAARQAPLSFTVAWNLLRFMSFELVILSKHLILCRPLLLLPSIFPSIRVFSNEPVLCIRWPKYWSFSISSSNEYSGLIFFRIDWFDFLAVEGTLKSLLQHHSLKASILHA